jgi:hypothetical protein
MRLSRQRITCSLVLYCPSNLLGGIQGREATGIKIENVAGDDWHWYISLQLWLTQSITRRRHNSLASQRWWRAWNIESPFYLHCPIPVTMNQIAAGASTTRSSRIELLRLIRSHFIRERLQASPPRVFVGIVTESVAQPRRYGPALQHSY